ILGRAERIATYAVGSNAALADYFAQSARRFGRSVITLHGRGQAAADDAIAIRRGDALLVLAFERTIPEVELILDRARRKGAASVLITDRLGLAFRGRVSATLNVERGDAGLFPLSAVVVAVLESLLLGLAGLDRARSLATLEELGALRARLPGA
ncbi:MAG: MurR/RpiR family transcriptional regulator, partial [Candidatus Limnocylindria bacterium]